MQNLLKFLAYFPLITLMLCDSNSTNDCNDVACTLQFAYLTVKVVDSQSKPVTLDSYEVILVEDGTDITPSDEDFFDEEGTYIVFSDNFANDYKNKNTVIRFNGFIDSEEVVSSEITVGADCCHVKMISESNVIVLD